MRISAGQLRERVELFSRELTSGTRGEQVETFTSRGMVWAADIPLQRRESEEDYARQSLADYRFLMRISSVTEQITAKWRLRWRGTTYETIGTEFDRKNGSLLAYVRGVESGAVAAVAAITLFAASALHSHAAEAGDLSVSGLPLLPAITRYVDLAAGDDSADGLTPATTWRHAPGMDGETGNAAAYNPVPGDHIAIRRGGRFHGRWEPQGSGALGNPVIYSGCAWGTGAQALIDGADATGVTVRLPTSQADAGGATNWNDPAMRVVEWTDDGQEPVLYDAAGMLLRSQWPRPLDPYLIDDFFAGPGLAVAADGVQLNASQTITDATLAAEAAGEVGGSAEVWVWVEGSQFARRPIASVVGDTVTLGGGAFSPTAYEPTTQVFLFSTVKHVSEPGNYAVIAPGKAIVMTRGSTAIRRAIDSGSVLTWKAVRVSGTRAHITLRGFDFTGFANVNPVSFTSTGGGKTGMKVLGCTFRDQWNTHALDGTFTNDSEFAWNRFENMVLTGGISDQGLRTHVHHNVIDGAGGTAIPSSRDIEGGRVEMNIVIRVGGVHANGMSNYAGQTNTQYVDNLVYLAERPMTIQVNSANNPLIDSGRVFDGNVFIARWTEEAEAGVWAVRFNSSRVIDGATFTRNLCMAVGGAGGIATYRTLSNFTFTNNWAHPDIDDQDGTPDNRATWTEGGNTIIPANYLDGMLIEADRCDILRPDATRLTLDLRTAGAG